MKMIPFAAGPPNRSARRCMSEVFVMRAWVKSLIVAVSFVFAVPAAFSQTEDPASQAADTYDFELVNNDNRSIRYRCWGNWATIAPDTSVEFECIYSRVEFFTHQGPWPVEEHNCPGGTRKVTITGSVVAVITTPDGSHESTEGPFTLTKTSECVIETESE